jgi:hypothetical protein
MGREGGGQGCDGGTGEPCISLETVSDLMQGAARSKEREKEFYTLSHRVPQV